MLLAGCAGTQRSRDLGNPDVSGATLAQQVCGNCHGTRGVSLSENFPNLAAQPADYLEGQLRSFRDRHRRDPSGDVYMWGLSRHLTDAQIAQLAAYFSAQAPAAAQPGGDAASIETGRRLFAQGEPARGIPACSRCHGEQGQGVGVFPRLAGQKAPYVIRQLAVLHRSDDARPLGSVMTVVAHSLSAGDMRALAAYVASMETRRASGATP